MEMDASEEAGAIGNGSGRIDVGDVDAVQFQIDVSLSGALAREKKQRTVAGTQVHDPGTILQCIELALPERQYGAIVVALDAGGAGMQHAGLP